MLFSTFFSAFWVNESNIEADSRRALLVAMVFSTYQSVAENP
jgi:hypothetical protein